MYPQEQRAEDLVIEDRCPVFEYSQEPLKSLKRKKFGCLMTEVLWAGKGSMWGQQTWSGRKPLPASTKGRAEAVRQKEGENVPSWKWLFPWKVSGNTPRPQKRKLYPGWGGGGPIDASLNPPECTSFSFIFYTSKDFEHPIFCFYYLEHTAFGDWWRTEPRYCFTSLFSMSDRRS